MVQPWFTTWQGLRLTAWVWGNSRLYCHLVLTTWAWVCHDVKIVNSWIFDQFDFWLNQRFWIIDWHLTYELLGSSCSYCVVRIQLLIQVSLLSILYRKLVFMVCYIVFVTLHGRIWLHHNTCMKDYRWITLSLWFLITCRLIMIEFCLFCAF